MIGNKKRNLPLDILRGLAVVIMIIVDAPPDYSVVPPLLAHSPWQGITVADLAFPAFVFAMGAAVAFTSARDKERPQGARRMKKILRRSAFLFGLGLAFNVVTAFFSWLFGGADFYDAAILHGRVFGVLQRLALTYCLGMLIIQKAGTLRQTSAIALVLLVLHSGGFHLYAPEAPFAECHNIALAVDCIFPGQNHVYPYNPCDPEGLYGTVSSVASMLLGYGGGKMLADKTGAGKLFGAGLLWLLIGVLWSEFDIIGKILWTAPFAALNAGGAMVFLALVGSLLRIAPKSTVFFNPLVRFGQNPLFFYLLSNFFLIVLWEMPSPNSELSVFGWLWHLWAQNFAEDGTTCALHMFAWCAMWYPLAEFLHRKGMIIKI